MVALEHQLLPGASRGVGVAFHLDEPVLSVPGVGPASVLGQVAVGVVGKGLTERFLVERNVALNYSVADLEADRATLDEVLGRP